MWCLVSRSMGVPVSPLLPGPPWRRAVPRPGGSHRTLAPPGARTVKVDIIRRGCLVYTRWFRSADSPLSTSTPPTSFSTVLHLAISLQPTSLPALIRKLVVSLSARQQRFVCLRSEVNSAHLACYLVQRCRRIRITQSLQPSRASLLFHDAVQRVFYVKATSCPGPLVARLAFVLDAHCWR